MRLRHRLHQVWLYVFARSRRAEKRARERLSPDLYALYQAMSRPDRSHGARVADRLAELGAPDQVVAAGYLHDAGKPRGYGLFWRCMMVLFGGRPPLAYPTAHRSWARARQIYHHHGRYAAEAIVAMGGPVETAALVEGVLGTPWLSELQRADDRG
ncbi:MAG: hypothetical protein KGR26_07975 [Cyanobacteria bacterium REEB65]|nr:hypothetical protein [Cyanobacteria bacterium REEB65]